MRPLFLLLLMLALCAPAWADSTYTYSGITNPSATHVATYGEVGSSTPPAPPAGTEFATSGAAADYTDLATSDDTRAGSTSSATKNAYQMFRFVVPAEVDVSAATELRVSWEGYGGRSGSPPVYHADLYLYRVSTSTWEIADTDNQTDSDATLTILRTANLADYHSSGVVYACAICPEVPTGGQTASISTDYVELTIVPLGVEIFIF